MRDFVDAIFEVIGAASLTDEEFAELDGLSPEYIPAVYYALKTILESRESISDSVSRLADFFKAAGVDVGEAAAEPTPRSNIFIGAAL